MSACGTPGCYRESFHDANGHTFNDGREKYEPRIKELEGQVTKLREALERRDHILKRLIAPCPQCHTLGASPDCSTVVHHLPREAQDDIRAALSSTDKEPQP